MSQLEAADIYREEACELLAELEICLLELEESPQDEELIARIFRAMHTVKGSGAMFGFDDIASFTHDIETIYDLIRNKKISVTRDIIKLTLSACDQIRLMVGGGTDVNRQAVTDIGNAFRKWIPKAAPDKKEPASPPPERPAAPEITYRIRFQPEPDIFATGTSISPLLAEIRDLGPCNITAQTDNIPQLADIDPENCYVFWDVVLTTDRGKNAIRDVFIFVEDRCKLTIEAIDRPSDGEGSGRHRKLGEILAERGDVNPDEVQKALGSQKKIGELLIESGLVSPDRISSALAEQQHVREMREKRQSAPEQTASIRVPAERLDRLVNMVGELVTVQSRLSQLSSSLGDADLALVAEEVERLTAELRDNTMSIRMLPIGNTFSKFKRLVHDLSTELGKDINLVTEGGETELDKTVIEKLNDPLVHLIRNSIDHGIETPDIRQASGKSKTGTVRLAAEHSGAHVLIHITDDGAGMDAEAIRRKALDKGLIAADAILTEKEIFSLIFAPGFSLAKTVTNVSGRGVGMDVVKKGIDALGGAVDISSRQGLGTTITLKLPLTLAIIDGLLVKIEESFFVIPLAAIEECVELTREDVKNAHGRDVIYIRGDMVPFIHLRNRFAIAGTPPAIEQIIINRVGDDRIGLVVDQVVGEHQTVIKNLGKFYRHIKEVSGATILGDGTVALIVDIPQLVSQVIRETA
jgi:two-component system chemotaxis sensor kinase CheA